MEIKDYRPEDSEVLLALNEKRIDELNENLKEFMHELFPVAKGDDVIRCWLCEDDDKPDIGIEVGEERHYLSLKSGATKGIHTESIKHFLPFIRELGISKESQKTLLLYQFGDCTLNGTGKVRYGAEELMAMMPERIKRLNVELNRRDVVRKCFRRFISEGRIKRPYKADYVAFGKSAYFIYCPIKALEDHIMRKNYSYMRAPHIGPMIIRPWLRNTSGPKETDWKREYVMIQYPYLITDIERIRQPWNINEAIGPEKD